MAIDLVLQLLELLAVLIHVSSSLLQHKLRQRGVERILRKANPQTRLISRDRRQGRTIEVVVGLPTRERSKRRSAHQSPSAEDGRRV